MSLASSDWLRSQANSTNGEIEANIRTPASDEVELLPVELITQEAEGKDIQLKKDGPAPPPMVSSTSAENLVTWDGPTDKNNPQNWAMGYKWLVTVILGMMTFAVTFASSVFSSAVQVTAKDYNVSTEVTTLGVSLFVLGFAIGPLIWGPFSELYGRKRPLFVGYTIFCIFNIPVAVASNIQTILVCRFFGGLFSSAPLAIIGGTLADFWDPVNRAVAVCVFAGATFIGPVAGPIVGGFVTKSHLGWRWTIWITLIMSSCFGVVGYFVISESYAPTLLQAKSKRLRRERNNPALYSKFDEAHVSWTVLAQKYMLRPFTMISQEPILMLFTGYISIVYGIIYGCLVAFPISFQVVRGWEDGVGTLPFLGILLGVIVGSGCITLITKTRFARKLKQHGRVIPEERLPSMIIGAVILPIGLFWFAWTSSPHISPAPQIIASVPIGAGVIMVFLPALNYIVDVYMRYANSALAVNIFLRSIIGAAFPLFTTYMYQGLGVDWGTSVFAFIALALAPLPIIFFIWGAKIRKTSRFYIPPI